MIHNGKSFPTYFVKESAILILLILLASFVQVSNAYANNDTLAVVGDSSLVSSDSVSVVGESQPLELSENINVSDSSSFNTAIRNDSFDFYRLGSVGVGGILQFYLPSSNNDFGSFGHPGFISLFGNSDISFLNGGLSFSSFTLFNQYDVSLINLSGIKVSSLTRGFLFSERISDVAIDLVSKEVNPKTPITQVLYFQAPNDEAEINLFFARRLLPRLIFSFNLTNKTISSRFVNSEYSHWSGKTELKYLVNSKLNLSVEYYYLKSIVGLNGGVDLDSIKRENPTSAVDAILYNNYLAPVLFPNRYIKTTSQKINFKALYKLSKNNLLTAQLYYADNLNEYRLNETGRTLSNNVSKIINNSEAKRIGINFAEMFNSNVFNLRLQGGFENLVADSPEYFNTEKINNFYLSGIISKSIFPNRLTVSLFQRVSQYNNKWYLGFGTDIDFNIGKGFTFYGGVSKYKKPFSLFEQGINSADGTDVLNAELSLKYKADGSLVKITSFFTDKQNSPFAFSLLQSNQNYHPDEIGFGVTNFSSAGINLLTEIFLSKFQLILNATYVNRISEFNLKVNQKIYANAGFYYVDSLFSDNLYLKSGLSLYFTGKENYFFYNFQTGNEVKFYETNTGEIQSFSSSGAEDNFTLDFIFSGRIQNKATLFFIIGNIMNKDYFIVPYFPKQTRFIRFGVSWDIYN